MVQAQTDNNKQCRFSLLKEIKRRITIERTRQAEDNGDRKIMTDDDGQSA
jgi:hypothetical protein